MKWNKYSIQTTTDAVDMISSAQGEKGEKSDPELLFSEQ